MITLASGRDSVQEPYEDVLRTHDGHGDRAAAAGGQTGQLLNMLGEAELLGVAVATEGGVQEINDAFRWLTGRDDGGLKDGPSPWPPLSAAGRQAVPDDAIGQLRRTGECGPYRTEIVRRDGSTAPALVGATVIEWRPLRWITFAADLSAPGATGHDRSDSPAAMVAARAEAARKARERLAFLLRVRERTSQLAKAAEGRRALETELRQTEPMRAIGQLGSAIAHDFGNLLGVISGYAELAEETSGDLDAELSRILGEIRETADRALHLTRDLLRFGAHASTEVAPVDLNALIADVSGLLAVSLRGRGTLDLKLAAAPLPPVLADRRQLEQVLLNLAINAREAMPDTGTLTIGTAVADLDDQAVHPHQGAGPGRYVELTVHDTGAGMSTDVRARIFERQFSTKRPGGGAGVGLSNARNIISAAGGFIEVESAEGCGTTFRIYLPAMSGTPSSR